MTERFLAILLKPYEGRDRCTIVDVVAGGDGFEGRWRVLRPLDLVGSWLVSLVDADRTYTVVEAAHVLTVRRGTGRAIGIRQVRHYITGGVLAPAGLAGQEIGIRKQGRWFISQRATWEMVFPKVSGQSQPKTGDR